jgi:cullin 2
MGTYHMAILWLFESVNSLTYKELKDSTQLSDEQLVKHLQSLVDAKIIVAPGLGAVVGTSADNPASPSSSSSSSILSLVPKEEATDKASLTLPALPSSDLTLSLNFAFVNKRTKFKITAVAQKEVQQQQETEQTHASVDEDRKLYLQAAIVRIMKARKIIKHNALIQEVIEQSKNRFSPSITMIKKCVEALMDKQYLERVANSTDEYSYVA